LGFSSQRALTVKQAEKEEKEMRNKLALVLAVIVVLSLATNAFAGSSYCQRYCSTSDLFSRYQFGCAFYHCPVPQPPAPPPAPNVAAPSDAFQVRYASNLNIGDSFINITNAGTQGGDHTSGNICTNVYTFAPDEQLISCCSCVVTPNAGVSLSARNDLISNTLTPAVPNSIVIKLIATAGAACNASAVTTANLAGGMRAWGTTLHATPTAGAYATTETEFSPAGLSAEELARIAGECGFIQRNGSGYGICRSCRLGLQSVPQ